MTEPAGDIRTFQIAPKGWRWPWNPVLSARCRFSSFETLRDTGEVQFERLEPWKKSRVGIRRWFNNLGKW